ncbi:hypothetical protein THRCLA_23006 [Thraustotheca clavata]|uniref:HTH CENPB-type domain-containing protein n=1 Tax=Thraustotheca clavata TaxID=74557 RepID=A0A1V9YJ68_9STRA|nr:hypothetical protein THRCLA_23006 [Thraustotheca clavata]
MRSSAKIIAYANCPSTRNLRHPRALGTTKILCKDAEDIIYIWLCKLRRLGVPVSQEKLREEALIVAADFGLASHQFKASSSWSSRFVRDYKLSNRKKTRTCQV